MKELKNLEKQLTKINSKNILCSSAIGSGIVELKSYSKSKNPKTTGGPYKIGELNEMSVYIDPSLSVTDQNIYDLSDNWICELNVVIEELI